MNIKAFIVLIILTIVVYCIIRIMGRIKNGHWHKANDIKKY